MLEIMVVGMSCWREMGCVGEFRFGFLIRDAGCRQAVDENWKSLSWFGMAVRWMSSGGARGCDGSAASLPRMCPRMVSMTSGSSIQAITRSLPPHLGQVSMAMAKTLFKRCIQVMGASGWSGFGSSGSRLGTTHSRCLQFGANTPWNRVRLSLGRGTKAARRAMKSSGSPLTANRWT